MSAPNFLVIAKQPFIETHGDATGSTMTDLVFASTRERADAEVIAQALRAQGWTVEVRVWSRRQRRAQDALGRLCWRAGFVEAAI